MPQPTFASVAGYSLEYGIDEMEMHEAAVLKGERHPGRRSHRHRWHRGSRLQAVKADRRQYSGGLLHHRSARSGRRRKDQEARRAGAHAGELRGALGRVLVNPPCLLCPPTSIEPGSKLRLNQAGCRAVLLTLLHRWFYTRHHPVFFVSALPR
jgi:hypothetical protein